MGKKSRRANKIPLPQKGQIVAAPSTLYSKVSRLLAASKFDEVSALEEQYRHLHIFCIDPFKDVFILHSFGNVIMNKEEDWGPAISYLERSRDLIVNNPDEDFQAQFPNLTQGIELELAICYSEFHDVEKSIAAYRWVLENSEREYVQTEYRHICHLGRNFIKFK